MNEDAVKIADERVNCPECKQVVPVQKNAKGERKIGRHKVRRHNRYSYTSRDVQCTGTFTPITVADVIACANTLAGYAQRNIDADSERRAEALRLAGRHQQAISEKTAERDALLALVESLNGSAS